jgi:glycosyltransferase involved in cell wall biosynthesis
MNDNFKTSGTPERRKRVCMLAYTSYATDGRVRLEAESLVQWGYEVCFLVLKTEPQPRSYRLCGVNVIELNVQKYRGKSKFRYLLSYLHFLVLAFVKCSCLFFRYRIHVIHVHNMPDLLVLAALIPRVFGCKVVLDIHDTVPETYAGKFEAPSRSLVKLLKVEEWLCCSFANQVIAVNHVQRDVIISRGVPAKKVSTVITMPTFSGRPQTQITRDGDQRFRLVNHGTVSKRLGNDLLIRAAAVLVRQIPGFELHIIGGGDDLEEIVQLSESLELSGHVHFHKGVPWDVLPQELCSMDVGIVANRVNIATQLMLPSKLIDYVSLGIPAVVPKLKAIEYYFTPDMVSYFDPENVQSMVTAVLSLYESRERRQHQSASARSFLDRYSWSKNSDLRELYAALTDAAPGETLAPQGEGTQVKPRA